MWLQILIKKKLQFLRICWLAYVLIFIKVFNLLENCYFDPKYHFVQFLCHFPSKIYITLGMNSLEKLSNFLRKVVIYLSILGKKWQLVLEAFQLSILKKMTICFISVNFFVMCVSLIKVKILQKHQFWRIFFIFVPNGHHFQKC